MKALFLLAYYYPETAASIYIFDNIITSLIDNGVDVELIVPIPGRGVNESVNIDYRKKLIQFEYGGHLKITRFKMYMEGKGSFERFIRYFLCCIKQFYIGIRAKNIDIIFSESTPPILGLSAILIKKLQRVPLIYNLQDIFPDSLVSTDITSKNSIIWHLGRVVEKLIYIHSDKIIAISNEFKYNLIRKCVPEEKIEVVNNWVDQNAVKNIPRNENKLFEKFHLNRDKFYITYNGNIGLSQNLDMLMTIVKDLELYKDIHFVLVGNGAYRQRVEDFIKLNQLENITLIPFQPYDDISSVFSLGDVSIVISKPGIGNACVPSKTWSILSASRPILANFDEGELKDIIENNNCGIFTKAGDKDAFKDSIMELYNDKEKAIQMGKNGRKFIINNLTKEIGSMKYVNIIKSVVLNHSSKNFNL